MKERESPPPLSLPEELADFLRPHERACLMHSSEAHGTVFVLKLPTADIESSRGTLPIQFEHELYDHPAAPVIRTVITIHDRPAAPLAFEVLTNLDDPQQGSEFAALAEQDANYLLFFDEQLRHRLAKRVTHDDAWLIGHITDRALALAAAIPRERYDFDRAKRAVLEATGL
jgi:hypothetical protein